MFLELIETKEPHLDVNEVPGQRAQHLKLGPFDVEAEVVHLGVAHKDYWYKCSTAYIGIIIIIIIINIFNVEAEVIHLGIAQRQQQTGSEILWY